MARRAHAALGRVDIQHMSRDEAKMADWQERSDGRIGNTAELRDEPVGHFRLIPRDAVTPSPRTRRSGPALCTVLVRPRDLLGVKQTLPRENLRLT